jgi:hypothetical protein
MPDVVVSFTGRATDKKVWVSLGAALGATFPPDRTPSEEEWRDLLKERSALRNPTVFEQRKGRVQRGTIAKRIPFYNMRYAEGVEQKLFQTLSGRIQEITAIFGTIPDFIVDRWVEDMLQDKEWNENTVLTIITDQQQNPFTIKETMESLDADWDGTAEVLNQIDALRELLCGW